MNQYENKAYETAVPAGPITSQLDQLDGRLESTFQELLSLIATVCPVLRDENEKGITAQPREVGSSPIHERLITLNAKASTLARVVADTRNRVTI